VKSIDRICIFVRTLFFLCLFVTFLGQSSPLEAWNHSELKWKTITTEHFEIHYHQDEEWSAHEVAAIAEEVYGPIIEFYGFEPRGTVHINLFDHDDTSEGATYYYLNRIDISAAHYDFHFRGTADWLRNVITHEFTHMVSVQLAMKMSLHIPSIYFQAVSFEREKRPDVITGYPNFQASLPFGGEIVPNWFAEGLAQYQCRLARNDFWDSHRDMLLRTATLNDGLLTLDEMGVFGKNSLQAEMVYNQGFSLVFFIVERFGHDRLVDLTSTLSTFYRWTFNGACKKVLKISEDELYRMWREELLRRYQNVARAIEKERIEGKRIAGRGFMNLFPLRAAEGSETYYLSNEGGDFSDLALVQMTPEGTMQHIADGVTSRFSISPDGKHLCYSKRTDKNSHSNSLNDLFIFDIESGKRRRLTSGLRASEPAWSPDGRFVACVVNKDGSERIATVDVESGNVSFVTSPVQGRQYFGLSWGVNGILSSRFERPSRDIVLIDTESGEEQLLVASLADERDPCWDRGGDGFFYASDRTGIFNIYYHDLEGSPEVQVTNCLGGAFNPSHAGDGLLYSGYGPDGYEIRELSGWREGAGEVKETDEDHQLMQHRIVCLGEKESAFQPDVPSSSHTEVGEDEGDVQEQGVKGFGLKYTTIYVFPRFLIYEGKPRLGIFLDTRDLMDRQSVSVGGSMNIDKEFDLQLFFEIRQFKPTFSLALFRSRKYYSYHTLIPGGRYFDFFTRYDLWDAFFTCSFELDPPDRYSRKELALQYNHGEYGLNIELWELLEQREFKGAVGWSYYKADEVSLLFHYKKIHEELHADINPRSGRTIDVEITRAFNKLHSGEFEYAYMPAYTKNDYGRYVLSYEEFMPLPFWHHALALRLSGGAIDRSDIDDFFYLYIGSRDGLRGYSYYSLGGRKMAMARLTYRFPILRRINWQFQHLYFSALYAAVFAEAGKAWDEDEFNLRGNKKDVGFELRLKGFSFYNFPLAASFEAAYGLDDVVYTDPFNELMTFYEGNSWKFYGSILFSF